MPRHSSRTLPFALLSCLSLATCIGTEGSPQTGSCDDGLVHCSLECVDLANDVNNCGECDSVCGGFTNDAQVFTCNNGGCVATCAPSFADCNKNVADGCEASLSDDAENCGSCGTACSNSQCLDFKCLSSITTIAAGVTYAESLALDDEYVYWIVTPQLARAPKAGGAIEVIATDEDLDPVGHVVVDDTHIYWTTKNTIKRVSKAGGAPSTLANDGGYYLALDQSRLYWHSDNHVKSMPKAGGSVTILGDLPSSFNSQTLINSENIYIVTDQLWWMPKDGSASPTPLSTATDSLGPAVADDDGVFFVSYSPPSIKKVAVTGGFEATIASEGAECTIPGLALDTFALYYSVECEADGTSSESRVMRVPRIGGEASTIVVVANSYLFNQAYDVAVDMNDIFWVEEADILKAAKLPPP